MPGRRWVWTSMRPTIVGSVVANNSYCSVSGAFIPSGLSSVAGGLVDKAFHLMPSVAPSRSRSRSAAPRKGSTVNRRSPGASASKMRGEAVGGLAGYLQESQTPLASLWFVLPLLVLHEWGVQSYATL